MKYQPVIGLEVHAQLRTESKIFCRCSTQFGGEPNSQTCPVCLGLPGVLPVLNRRAVEFAVKMGLVAYCEIAATSIFARKNYFYPDLPKGYQISQFERPLCSSGYLEITCEGVSKRIGINRIHLEEDAGKSIHDESFVREDESLVDLNRCGVPLVEIVTEPDLNSSSEAGLFLRMLRQIVQYLEICDGNMEEGSLRCDANVSVRPVASEQLGIKTELKNMNSIRGVERALQFEIKRQTDKLEKGEKILQQTLLWDADSNQTVPMRSKEYSDDYRYCPEPDLLPLNIDPDLLENIRDKIPELPLARQRRFMKEFDLPEMTAGVLTEDRELADYFEQTAEFSSDAKTSANWIVGEVRRKLNEKKMPIRSLNVMPQELAKLIAMISQDTLSNNAAKKVFDKMIESGRSADRIVQDEGLAQVSDTDELQNHVSKVIKDNPEEIKKYLNGKEQILGYLVGQVMKATRGQANPKLVSDLLLQELKK